MWGKKGLRTQGFTSFHLCDIAELGQTKQHSFFICKWPPALLPSAADPFSSLSLQILSELWDWGLKEEQGKLSDGCASFWYLTDISVSKDTQHSTLPIWLLVRNMGKGKYSRYYLVPVLPQITALYYYKQNVFFINVPSTNSSTPRMHSLHPHHEWGRVCSLDSLRAQELSPKWQFSISSTFVCACVCTPVC